MRNGDGLNFSLNNTGMENLDKSDPLKEKSFQLAIRIVKLCQYRNWEARIYFEQTTAQGRYEPWSDGPGGCQCGKRS